MHAAALVDGLQLALVLTAVLLCMQASSALYSIRPPANIRGADVTITVVYSQPGPRVSLYCNPAVGKYVLNNGTRGNKGPPTNYPKPGFAVWQSSTMLVIADWVQQILRGAPHIVDTRATTPASLAAGTAVPSADGCTWLDSVASYDHGTPDPSMSQIALLVPCWQAGCPSPCVL